MNEPLLLRGKAFNRTPAQPGGSITLPKGSRVTLERVQELRHQLEVIASGWPRELGPKALITARYTRIAAKSNRFGRLLGAPGVDPSSRIVGSRFDIGEASDGTQFKHIIVYAVPLKDVEGNIALLRDCEAVITRHYPKGFVEAEDIDRLRKQKLPKNSPLPSTTFAQSMRDTLFCEKLWLDRDAPDPRGAEAIYTTLYKDAGLTPAQVISETLGPQVISRLEDNRVLLLTEEYERLRAQAPYFIAMALDTTWNQTNPKNPAPKALFAPSIPAPNTEPTIGIIDYAFDRNAYFSDWVEYEDWDTDSPAATPGALEHGTAVASVIVDGPALNPRLEDECGRFKARFFGISHGTKTTQTVVLDRIRRIVEAHHADIKVWNISMGTDDEVPMNSVSPTAALLDELQSKYDVLFVVAGTNRPATAPSRQSLRIGSPADSVNSIVVSSVDSHGAIAGYDRVGPVLSFFAKPDLATVGGTGSDKLVLWHSEQASPADWEFQGTSFAAPWIARKAAFLIHKIGLTRELTKALLMDAARGWSSDGLSSHIGFGVVPQSIRDVLYTPNDEFRFMVYGNASAKHTDCQEFYIPYRDGKQPFVARATMAYFPPCDINQGVDYTQMELGLQFGRIQNGKIKPIDRNAQTDEGAVTYESDARKYWRKWDPVKRCAHTEIERRKPMQVMDHGKWGFKVTRTPRYVPAGEEVTPVPFGLVCTFKNLNGKNQIQEFIAACRAEDWLVDRLDIDVATTLYGSAQTHITFE